MTNPDTSMDKPSEKVIEIYKDTQHIPTAISRASLVVLADYCRDERAKRLRLKHKWQADHAFLKCDRCSWTFADYQALAHRQLMGEET